MKATGIVRRIDDLGRVVIPKEIRRTLRIREGDPLEIFVDRDGEVILKKYSPINLFVKDVHLVWNEVSRVLKNKGILISGFTNPLLWIFDDNQEQKGILDVKHSINCKYNSEYWMNFSSSFFGCFQYFELSRLQYSRLLNKSTIFLYSISFP